MYCPPFPFYRLIDWTMIFPFLSTPVIFLLLIKMAWADWVDNVYNDAWSMAHGCLQSMPPGHYTTVYHVQSALKDSNDRLYECLSEAADDIKQKYRHSKPANYKEALHIKGEKINGDLFEELKPAIEGIMKMAADRMEWPSVVTRFVATGDYER